MEDKSSLQCTGWNRAVQSPAGEFSEVTIFHSSCCKLFIVHCPCHRSSTANGLFTLPLQNWATIAQFSSVVAVATKAVVVKETDRTLTPMLTDSQSVDRNNNVQEIYYCFVLNLTKWQNVKTLFQQWDTSGPILTRPGDFSAQPIWNVFILTLQKP